MTPRVIEKLSVRTPLGLRFWDGVLERVVSDALDVTAWPVERPAQSSRGLRTQSGVFVFRWLPGLRAVEYPRNDEPLADSLPEGPRRFVVSVSDRLRRFLPSAFEVQLPLPYQGVFLAEGGASLEDDVPPAVHLFSAASRAGNERVTAVHATLRTEDDRPAAWALLRVSAPHGRVAYGMADDQGRCAVHLTYPSLAQDIASSEPSLSRGFERAWDIEVSVFYQPRALTSLPGTSVPEYRSILRQARAKLWSSPPDISGTPLDARELRLVYGQPLVLRCEELPVQFVTPAA